MWIAAQRPLVGKLAWRLARPRLVQRATVPAVARHPAPVRRSFPALSLTVLSLVRRLRPSSSRTG